MKYILPLVLSVIIGCQGKSSFDDVVSESNDFDILIQGGQFIDGTGVSPFQADLLIRADTIAYIGSVDVSRINTSKIIDAKDYMVTPGFIDTHAHGDPLFGPEMNNFISMGVTSIVIGQDGSHLSGEMSLEQRMDAMEEQGTLLNVASLAGHGTLRSEAGVHYEGTPTEEQLTAMGEALQTALDIGCFGMSTGLEYVSGMNAEEDELIYLAKIVGNNDGLIMSHMRNEDDDQIDASIDELLVQGQHCKVHVSHLKVVYGKGKDRGQQILTRLENARSNGINVTADSYPYTASYTTIGIVFPEWSKTPEQFEIAKRDRKTELKDYLFKRVRKRNGPEATLLASAPYTGKTLAQLAEESGTTYVDVLMEMGPNGSGGAFFIMEDSLHDVFIESPDVMISSDGSPTMRHPRGYGTFAKIIERYVMKKRSIPIELAVHKMTGLPAQTMGFQARGTLQVGNAADVLVFKPEEVKENATFADPFQLADGFNHVIINGILVKSGGRVLVDNAGQLLRKKGPKTL